MGAVHDDRPSRLLSLLVRIELVSMTLLGILVLLFEVGLRVVPAPGP